MKLEISNCKYSVDEEGTVTILYSSVDDAKLWMGAERKEKKEKGKKPTTRGYYPIVLEPLSEKCEQEMLEKEIKTHHLILSNSKVNAFKDFIKSYEWRGVIRKLAKIVHPFYYVRFLDGKPAKTVKPSCKEKEDVIQ